MVVAVGQRSTAYLGSEDHMTVLDIGIRAKQQKPSWIDEHPYWTIAIVFGVATPLMAFVILVFT